MWPVSWRKRRALPASSSSNVAAPHSRQGEQRMSSPPRRRRRRLLLHLRMRMRVMRLMCRSEHRVSSLDGCEVARVAVFVHTKADRPVCFPNLKISPVTGMIILSQRKDSYYQRANLMSNTAEDEFGQHRPQVENIFNYFLFELCLHQKNQQ